MFKKQTAYSYESLLLSGKKELFGENNPQLPMPPMLMFDRITHIDEKSGEFGQGQIVAELDIKPDIWFFDCHFYNDPVMPGCLSLDAMWQLLGFFMGWKGLPGKGRALGVGETKFSGQITPDNNKVVYRIDIKRVLKKGALNVGVANGTTYADDTHVHSAKGLRVALFQSIKNC